MKLIYSLILAAVTCLGCVTNQMADRQTEEHKIESTPVVAANWGTRLFSITEGMTSAQVQSILGPPSFTRGKSPVVYLYYRFITHDCFVKLVNGRVEAVGKSEHGLELL